MKDSREELQRRRMLTSLMINLVTIVCTFTAVAHLVMTGAMLPPLREIGVLGLAVGLTAWLWWRDFGRPVIRRRQD
jgi:hypothetical protein